MSRLSFFTFHLILVPPQYSQPELQDVVWRRARVWRRPPVLQVHLLWTILTFVDEPWWCSPEIHVASGFCIALHEMRKKIAARVEFEPTSPTCRVIWPLGNQESFHSFHCCHSQEMLIIINKKLHINSTGGGFCKKIAQYTVFCNLRNNAFAPIPALIITS